MGTSPRQYDAQVISNSELAPRLSSGYMQTENMKTVRLVDFRGDANLEREPDYYLYIFNIAPRKFLIRRPPNFPLLTFAACPEGQPYALVGRVPNVVNEKWIDADSGETRVRGMAGERFAMDLINPANIGVDMWREIEDEALTWIDGGTDDMSRRGLFWSRNETPTPEELRLAKNRMEKHYRSLLRHADELSRDPKTAREIGMEHHMAADYFHVKASWHIVAELPEICPNCGEAYKAGAAYHVNSVGMVCVIDWKRTIAAGVKKKEDLPEGIRL